MDHDWHRAHGYSPASPGWNMSQSELQEFEGRWPKRMVDLRGGGKGGRDQQDRKKRA